MQRQNATKYQRSALLNDNDDNYNEHNDGDHDNDDYDENTSTFRGCLQYKKIFGPSKLHQKPNNKRLLLHETTTLVNNNRDFTLGAGGTNRQQQQHKPALQIINNSFDDEGEGPTAAAASATATGEQQGEGATTDVNQNQGPDRTDTRYRQKFQIGLCTARRSWLGLKSSPGDAFGTQSRYNGRRRFDKLRSWTRSNNYSGVSYRP